MPKFFPTFFPNLGLHRYNAQALCRVSYAKNLPKLRQWLSRVGNDHLIKNETVLLKLLMFELEDEEIQKELQAAEVCFCCLGYDSVEQCWNILESYTSSLLRCIFFLEL